MELILSVLSLLRMSTRANRGSRSHQHAKRRNHTGVPDADTEVVALSPNTLMATNRFLCEICNKGFQREQNLQLHRRGHNLPWKLRRASGKPRRKVYVCPEPSCEHHHPSMALGDITGINKHYSRKHGEKNLKCEKCGKMYAVFSDWKAHSKTCGTREYRCNCGAHFNRKDSFLTHRAFCGLISQEKLMPSSSLLLPPEFNFDVPPEAPAMFFNGIMMSHSTDNDDQLSSYYPAMNFYSDHHHAVADQEVIGLSAGWMNRSVPLDHYQLNLNDSQPTKNSISSDYNAKFVAPVGYNFAGESSAQALLGAGLEINSSEFGKSFGLDYKSQVPPGGFQELMMNSNYEMLPTAMDIHQTVPPPVPVQSSFLTRDFLGNSGDASNSNSSLQRELDKFMSNATANLLSSSSCNGAAGVH